MFPFSHRIAPVRVGEDANAILSPILSPKSSLPDPGPATMVHVLCPFVIVMPPLQMLGSALSIIPLLSQTLLKRSHASCVVSTACASARTPKPI